MTIRRFAQRLLIAGVVAASAIGFAADAPVEGALELKALHSGETIRFHVREGSPPDAETQRRLSHVLRDRRTNGTRDMDPMLFVQLVRLAAAAGVEARYEIISAYRSPETNAKLSERSSGVSSRSLHMEGRAMDVRLQGVDTLRLATLARELAMGGVGYYPVDRWVHVDTGRVRTWEN